MAASASCLTLEVHCRLGADWRALLSAGNSMLINSAIMPMTTSSSTNVKAFRRLTTSPRCGKEKRQRPAGQERAAAAEEDIIENIVHWFVGFFGFGGPSVPCGSRRATQRMVGARA